MKHLIYLLMTSLISMTAFAENRCLHQVIESTGTIMVVPVYEAKATYFFDNEQRKAHAVVYWNLNTEMSKDCFKSLEQSYPNHEIKLAGLRVADLSVNVFKGKTSEDLIIYPEAGGFYNGSTDMIQVDYNAKSEIKKAIDQKKDLITINGEVKYDFISYEKGIVGQIECISNPLPKGVLGLHTRLGEIIKSINSRPIEEKVNREEVLDQFMTSCVEFKEIDSVSLTSFESQLKRKTLLIEGTLLIMGNIKKENQVKVGAIGHQESTALDY